MGRRRALRSLGSLLAALSVAAAPARAEPVEAGRVVPDLTLALVRGGGAPLVAPGSRLTALVFFRAGQERSSEALRMLAGCRPRLAKEPVRVVGVVPPDSAQAAGAAVDAAGVDLPVLVDAGDEVYATLGVRAHPTIVIVDRSRRVAASFHQVSSCDAVVARIQRALGEIGDAEAERVLAPAATPLPGDSVRAVAHRHVALARRLLAARSHAAAHESARKAIALAPSAEAWRVEGEVFVAEGRCPEAVRAFDAALALDPKDAAATAARLACQR